MKYCKHNYEPIDTNGYEYECTKCGDYFSAMFVRSVPRAKIVIEDRKLQAVLKKRVIRRTVIDPEFTDVITRDLGGTPMFQWRGMARVANSPMTVYGYSYNKYTIPEEWSDDTY